MHVYLGIIASAIGLAVSIYIFIKKRRKSGLMCPLRTKCDEVINSAHSKTLGIPNEILGIAYYAITGAYFIAAYTEAFPILGITQLFAVLFISFGMLFSVYLISLQAMVIRAWCMWCLLSALANILLVISLFGFPAQQLFEILSESRVLWVIAHNIGFILGLGGATITDVFFFRFLKDNKISIDEKGTMDTLSSVIWFGLAILIITGIMLYLPEQARLNESPKFLLKVVVVGVVLINGLLLNLLVAPKLHMLSFENTIPARRFRRLAFALGGVSIVSWYSAFVLGSIRSIETTLGIGLIGYFALVACAVIGSQIYEALITRKNT